MPEKGRDHVRISLRSLSGSKFSQSKLHFRTALANHAQRAPSERRHAKSVRSPARLVMKRNQWCKSPSPRSCLLTSAVLET